MSQERPLPPISPPLHGFSLTFISLLAALLIALAFTLTIAGKSLTENWQERLTQKALIALPPTTNTPSAPQQDPRLITLTQHLKPLPQIQHFHILRPQDIQALLSTWSAPWPDPLPLAISFSYTGDNQHLENFIHKFAPDALFIPSPPQKNLLPPLQNALIKATRLLSSCLSLIAVFIFILGLTHILLFTLLKEEQTLIMLHQIGSTKNILYNRISLMAAFQTFIGAIFGIFIALPLINLLALYLRPFKHLSLWTDSLFLGIFETALPLHSLFILWSIPFILTIFAIFITQIILNMRHHLKS